MSKYSKQIVREICEYLEEGLSQKDAALLAGISETTFYEWANSKPEFSESVTHAITNYKRKLIGYVNKDAATNGNLAMKVLERKWPNEFGFETQNASEDNGKVEARADDVREFAKGLLEITK